MRQIDGMRYHTPTDDEQKSFNLTNERASVHVFSSFLALCGSRKGCRFDTSELSSTLPELCNELASLFNATETLFKKLSAENKKLKLLTVIEENNTTTDNSIDEYRELKDFQERIFLYVSKFKEAVEVVEVKRQSIKDNGGAEVDMDPEAELKLANPLPNYLVILLKKYKDETSPTIQRGMILDSLVRFSAFLASMALRIIPSTDQEEKAILFLVGGCKTTQEEDETNGRCEIFWRRRFFFFLKNLRELKGVSKREKDLEDKIWDFASGGEEIIRKRHTDQKVK